MKLVGTRLGNYKLKRRVRTSARGTLFLARNTGTGRDVMLELIEADEGMRAQIKLETRAAKQVPHRAIVDLLDQGESEQGVWFVTEKVRGESLARRLRRKKLDADEIALIFGQLIDIVGAFQKVTLVHGGLDVSQVVLEETAADKIRVRVLDFGIVRKENKFFGSFEANTKAEAQATAERNALITRGLNVDVLLLGQLLMDILPKRFPRERFARVWHYRRVAQLCMADKPGRQLRDCVEVGRQFQLAAVKVDAPLETSSWMWAFFAVLIVVFFSAVIVEGIRHRAPQTQN